MSQSAARSETPLVLVVDDEAFMRKVLRDALEQGGYAVLEARDGLEALAAAREHSPDLVLLDVVMPKLDGIATCARLRRRPEGEHLPILMVTAAEDTATINLAYGAGATDFISKPINATHLNHHIRYILRSSRLFADLRQNEARLRLSAKVFECSGEMILVTDPAGRIVDANASFSRLTGYPPEALPALGLDALMADVHDAAFARKLRASLVTRGEWKGEFWIRCKNGGSFPALVAINAVHGEEGGVSHFVAIAADLSRLRETEQRLHYLANFDPLTDLPNRLRFGERLQQSLAERIPTGIVPVFYLDLDDFKEINETLGHQAGDEVLREIARRLQGCIGERDTVGRVGGDEFAVLMRSFSLSEEAAGMAERLLECFARPFTTLGGEVFLNASAGVALSPHDGLSGEELIRNAQTAMHHAKQAGKHRFVFFSERMNHQVRERLLLKNNLRQGLSRDEFLLHYQPKFDSRSGRFTGLEALARWQHPGRGLVWPSHFIPLAEETGLIVPLGESVLEIACAQNRAWQARGFPPFRVAVNLSAQQFRDRDLVATVRGVLQRTGLASNWLELEITETVIMQDTERAVAILEQLRAMGIRITLDDFGTGYSSLSYLKRLPVDCLKIDYTFIKGIFSDPQDAAIVRAIIAMAHSLRLKVVAEGVETEAQRVFLREQGCDEVQGYLAAMPLPVQEVEQYLA
ncbi:hypothetical protein DESUT3_35920 [Desulfuromonas versatilis]|uniref:Response regulator receiver modulated diguanylate cyclase/phosphodiesterase with PAS/PAC sensor(S) n=1 Tax=Desulfuromonas versatilis TaxID=2802975 RepID=A0ABN6E2H3_9BACT|nr:EAL domain-containing protein [Desulfuromonas versatilis]BCR06523.1 hypothetical protein DESUT3_35920 [Desulfuromonas versatilis]